MILYYSTNSDFYAGVRKRTATNLPRTYLLLTMMFTQRYAAAEIWAPLWKGACLSRTTLTFHRFLTIQRYLGTDHQKSDGGGRGIFRLEEFFLLFTTCAQFVFSGETLCTNFFSNKQRFFLSEILILYLFFCFINYSTLTTDQRMRAIF